MTEVVYDRAAHRLTLKGHAGADVPGKDIVCSAMTILAYTYAQACINAATQRFAKSDNVYTRFEEGDIEVSIKPYRKYGDMVTVILDNICLGYALLRNRYPENLTLEITG
ncbi:MAG: ribosomal-processing cysteine protease Prp [Clostridia bacterium]|nr:ribosomal-processing cysteine protease Prp [Clostridia bacterium]